VVTQFNFCYFKALCLAHQLDSPLTTRCKSQTLQWNTNWLV